jgi:hypothetical protein
MISLVVRLVAMHTALTVALGAVLLLAAAGLQLLTDGLP